MSPCPLFFGFGSREKRLLFFVNPEASLTPDNRVPTENPDSIVPVAKEKSDNGRKTEIQNQIAELAGQRRTLSDKVKNTSSRDDHRQLEAIDKKIGDLHEQRNVSLNGHREFLAGQKYRAFQITDQLIDAIRRDGPDSVKAQEIVKLLHATVRDAGNVDYNHGSEIFAGANDKLSATLGYALYSNPQYDYLRLQYEPNNPDWPRYKKFPDRLHPDQEEIVAHQDYVALRIVTKLTGVLQSEERNSPDVDAMISRLHGILRSLWAIQPHSATSLFEQINRELRPSGYALATDAVFESLHLDSTEAPKQTKEAAKFSVGIFGGFRGITRWLRSLFAARTSDSHQPKVS